MTASLAPVHMHTLAKRLQVPAASARSAACSAAATFLLAVAIVDVTPGALLSLSAQPVAVLDCCDTDVVTAVTAVTGQD